MSQSDSAPRPFRRAQDQDSTPQQDVAYFIPKGRLAGGIFIRSANGGVVFPTGQPEWIDRLLCSDEP
ncbi:Fc.00g102310.m01.CDS01 [Cosmosporella sp. VM-42]